MIEKISVELQVSWIYYLLQKEEKPKLEAVYERFGKDYQSLLEKHAIKLPFDVGPLGSDMTHSWPSEQPLNAYMTLAAYLKGSHMLISHGELHDWNPPQENMTDSRAMGGFIAFAMFFLFGVPGLLFALFHIIQLKDAAKRNGLFLACFAIFIWPIMITLGSIPVFIFAMAEMPNSDDHYMFLFIAIFGMIATALGVYCIRRYLKNSKVRDDAP